VEIQPSIFFKLKNVRHRVESKVWVPAQELRHNGACFRTFLVEVTWLWGPTQRAIF